MCMQNFIKIFQTVEELYSTVFRIWTSAKPRPIPNVIWLSHGLHHVNINVYAKFHHDIPLSSRDRAIFTFFRIWSSAKPRPTKNVISQSFGLDLVNINVYANVYQNIPLSSRERAIFTFFRIWTSATPRPIPNDIWQSLGLHLVNINAYAKCYQNIPNGLRVIDIFHEQAGDRIFTNRPGTKSSQTVRWQNQMFDYRALYEIQLQVSVDFLRVVQFVKELQVKGNPE